tara:strand:- start:1042 stop:1449 length:408 start_codon:yes stop_codon:yes gene_type:complete
MLGALGARHAGVQVAVMLEEIQVPPGLVGEIVSRTGLAALRTGVEAASLGLDVEVQTVGRYGGIQVLVLENPGRFQAQAEGQNLGAVHVVPPVVVEVISWPSSGGNSTPNDEEPEFETLYLPSNISIHLSKIYAI